MTNARAKFAKGDVVHPAPRWGLGVAQLGRRTRGKVVGFGRSLGHGDQWDCVRVKWEGHGAMKQPETVAADFVEEGP